MCRILWSFSVTHKVLIANTRRGLERDVTEFLLPNDAYPDLEDVYPFRGRIEKRPGMRNIGRIVTNVPSESKLNASGASYSTTLTNTPISPGSVSITVGAVTFADAGNGTLVGTPGTNSGTINYATGAVTLSFSPALGAPTAVTATYDYFNLLPCMGLRSQEISSINQVALIGFDTIKANLYSNSLNRFTDISTYKTSGATVTWTGSDSQFFWTTNYQSAFWETNSKKGFQVFTITKITSVVNAVITFTGGDVFQNGDVIAITNVVNAITGPTAFNINGLTGIVSSHGAGTITVNIDTSANFTYSSGGILHSLTRTQSGDGIRWYDSSGWVNFSPPLNASATGTNVTILQGALIMLPYKDRLVCLNTFEGTTGSNTTNFSQRCRFSEIGTVYYNALTPTGFAGSYVADSWRDDVVGKGGFVDAPTAEQIISAEFIKDTLIVFFERSTYQLRWVGDPTTPFIFEKINTELGSESTFSIMPFDAGVLGISNVGVMTCDSVQVKRIDELIPDEVFKINYLNNGTYRIYGIRDYFKELAYWTFPGASNNPIYPTRILVYNYHDGSYSFFNDSTTCFGYWQPFNDLTWAQLPFAWATQSWAWNSPQLQADFPNIVAGNQQGFVSQLVYEQNINTPTLQITNATQAAPCVVTSNNHNLQPGEFILIANVQGMTDLNGYALSPNGIYQVGTVTTNTISLLYIDTNGVAQNVDSTGFGAYVAKSGTMTFINNFIISTKQFSPFIGEGVQSRLNYLDLFMDAASSGTGEFTINIYTDQDSTMPVTALTCSQQSGTNTQDRVWVRNIPNVIGQFIFYEMTLSNLEMINIDDFGANIVLHAALMHFNPASRLVPGINL